MKKMVLIFLALIASVYAGKDPKYQSKSYQPKFLTTLERQQAIRKNIIGDRYSKKDLACHVMVGIGELGLAALFFPSKFDNQTNLGRLVVATMFFADSIIRQGTAIEKYIIRNDIE